MRNRLRIFFIVILTVAIFFSAENCFAEDLRFIDAKDDIGYYVDASTIRVESDSVFFADLVIIRASINQMEVINLRINHWQRTYAIQSVRTLSYDGRTELKVDNNPRRAASYNDRSLIGDVVHFVVYGSL